MTDKQTARMVPNPPPHNHRSHAERETHERVMEMIEDLKAEGDLGPNHMLFNWLAGTDDDDADQGTAAP